MERRKIIHPRSAKTTEACDEVNDGGVGVAKSQSKMGTVIAVSVPQLTWNSKPQTPCLIARTAIWFLFPKSIKGMHALDLFNFVYFCRIISLGFLRKILLSVTTEESVALTPPFLSTRGKKGTQLLSMNDIRKIIT